jgi:LuxR family transcriptional regulator, maltose regulon positive regulatory protein
MSACVGAVPTMCSLTDVSSRGDMVRSRISVGEQLERDELLATKLTIPRVRHDSLARSRLLEALDEAVNRELTLVCTPAGFGKTTLLADWAHRSRRPVGWLSLDPGDSDPVRFWRYVVAALDRAGVPVADQVRPLLERSRGTSITDLITAAINAIEIAPDDVALVLDDYHTVESPTVHETVAFLLGHLPRPLHLVIASRSDPLLPLSRLRARNQLVDLRATDLRFTHEEETALLRDVWRLDLPPNAIAVLDSRTEGWVVGLQLAALSLREHPDPDAFLKAFTGSHRYVLDYLSEEVVERQPERLRTFLLQTSILERLTGSLCDAVTGRSDSHVVLEELERANLFLIPLDAERRWYRFHHLFGDLLRTRLHGAGGESVPELHRRAGAWSEVHGLIDEAIRHAGAAGEQDWAARLVEEHMGETLRRGEGVILDRWLSALPDDVIRTRPKLCLAQGWMQLHIGHLDSAARLADHAERALARGAASGDVEVPTLGGMVSDGQAAIALLRADLAGAKGDIDADARWARLALAQIGPEDYGPRFLARFQLACADWMSGRLADAEVALASLLEEGRTTPDPYPLLSSCFALAQVQAGRGRLSAALKTNRESLRFATDGGSASAFHAGEAHIGIAQVLYQRDELHDALQHANAGVELCRPVVEFVLPAIGLITLGWIRQAMGETEAALEAMDEACRIRPSHGFVAIWNPAQTERARLLIAQGRVTEAERWADEQGLSEDDEVGYAEERDYLVLARLLLAKHDPARAHRLLDRLDDLARSHGRGQSIIEIRVLRSLALQSAGDQRGALATLAAAVAMARAEEYVRVFADEGPPMAVLVQKLIRHQQRDRAATLSRGAGEHLLRVARGFRAPARPRGNGTTVTSGLVEPLTTRELEVLGLLAAGRRNRQIADELVVTIDTVKRHVSHIFDKLGTTNRTEAVTRARQLDLIP